MQNTDLLKELLTLNSTSDHTRQALRVREYNREYDKEDKVLVSISGSTWNCLNLGHGKNQFGPGSSSNNPFDIDESNDSYLERKRIQIFEILEQIDSFKKPNQYSKIDFILLQEVDWLSKTNYVLKKLNLIADQDKLKALILFFVSELKARKWEILTPSYPMNSKSLVTLYDTKVLSVYEHNGIPQIRPIFPVNGKNTGYEVLFVHTTTQKMISIVNLHLDRMYDYRQDILDYQFECRSLGLLSILGGDTNHAQNLDQIGLIGGWQFPTQVGGKDRTNSSLRLKEPGNLFIKRYDGFFVGPSSADTRIEATELLGKYFKKFSNNSIKAVLLDPEVAYKQDAIDNGRAYFNDHIHTNGHYHGLAYGSPYFRNYIKLFLSNLLRNKRLLVSSSGAPLISCIPDFNLDRAVYDQARKDYRDVVALYDLESVERAKIYEITGQSFLAITAASKAIFPDRTPPQAQVDTVKKLSWASIASIASIAAKKVST